MRTCGHCETPLPEGSHANRKYCSVKCRNAVGNRRVKERELLPEEHGRPVGYISGCRCDKCRAQNAAYSRLVRSRQPKGPRKQRSDKGVKRKRQPDAHGTVTGYKFPCRCTECTAAASEYNRQWRKANRERSRRYAREYRRRNPERFRGYGIERKAAPFDDTAMAYAAVIEADPCSYCGTPAEQIDHIEPVSRSVDSSWSNLAPTCKRCNQRKAAMSLLMYLARRMTA